jgi:hypothetical protein
MSLSIVNTLGSKYTMSHSIVNSVVNTLQYYSKYTRADFREYWSVDGQRVQ